MIKKISRRRRRFHRESSDERRAVHYSTSIARVRVRDEKKKQQKVSLSPSQKRGSKERCLTFASYFTCFMCPRLLLGSFVYLISKESEERPEKKNSKDEFMLLISLPRGDVQANTHSRRAERRRFFSY
jgi:hypothetical protein